MFMKCESKHRHLLSRKCISKYHMQNVQFKTIAFNIAFCVFVWKQYLLDLQWIIGCFKEYHCIIGVSVLGFVFAQSIETRCLVENEDVVGGAAPTTSELSSNLLPIKVWLILEIWRYIIIGHSRWATISVATFLVPCHVVKSLQLISNITYLLTLQLIWSSVTHRWNVRLCNLHMS